MKDFYVAPEAGLPNLGPHPRVTIVNFGAKACCRESDLARKPGRITKHIIEHVLIVCPHFGWYLAVVFQKKLTPSDHKTAYGFVAALIEDDAGICVIAPARIDEPTRVPYTVD